MSTKCELNFPVAKKTKVIKSSTKKRKAKSVNQDCAVEDVYAYGKIPKLNEMQAFTLEDELKNVCDILNGSTNEQFYERTAVTKELLKNLDYCLNQYESISLYVCGPSGTGKTATLKYLQSLPHMQKHFNIIHIDCLAYRYACTKVYEEIILKLDGSIKGLKTQRDLVDRMLKMIDGSKKAILLILDDIDVLKTRNQTVLYSLFELPSRFNNGRITLISVGNVINFVDRFLPRLKSVFFFKKPVTIEFPSYQDQELIDIITKRLNKVNLNKIKIDPPALNLLGKKAASVSGDARNALQLAKEVIEKCVGKSSVGSCVIKPIDVQIVMNDILGEVEKLTYLDNLPLHQKIIICSVLLVIQDPKFDRTKLTIGTIEVMYRKVCLKRRLQVCHTDEFLNMFSLIESTGIFSVSSKKKNRNSKVTMKWGEDEIRDAFQDKILFGDILND